MDFQVKDGQKFLFIGDSITDCGRRVDAAPFGNGYVRIFRDLITANFPDRRIEFINKGIGGDTVVGLRQRWEDDVIYHKPDWLSILIGINDVHRFIMKGLDWEKLDAENYRACYDEILKKTKEKLSCGIILMEPFYITLNKTDYWRGEVTGRLAEYRKAVAELSKKYNTLMIKTQDIFNNHLKYRDSETFSPESVHLNQTGHLIIADALFNILKK
ncbi:MAG: SGNH/GDSL hydrolase family protein [Candidatus Omnitrophica bacterium]|nr:SGNH/GDSL hydrolase family protein [Candidatus Omnitrophota bacterium]